jgi:hypothetical protein
MVAGKYPGTPRRFGSSCLLAFVSESLQPDLGRSPMSNAAQERHQAEPGTKVRIQIPLPEQYLGGDRPICHVEDHKSRRETPWYVPTTAPLLILGDRAAGNLGNWLRRL